MISIITIRISHHSFTHISLSLLFSLHSHFSLLAFLPSLTFPLSFSLFSLHSHFSLSLFSLHSLFSNSQHFVHSLACHLVSHLTLPHLFFILYYLFEISFFSCLPIYNIVTLSVQEMRRGEREGGKNFGHERYVEEKYGIKEWLNQ